MKLCELADNPWKPKKLSEDEMMQWCNTHASKYLDRNIPIFRGTSNSRGSGIVDTTRLNRTSRTKTDYYNWWIDNAASWQDFPKRSESFICSLDKRVAQGFGDLNLVIPSDDCLIGICPSDDIWSSFKLKTSVSDIYTFVAYLNGLLVGGKANTWEELKTRLLRTTIEDINSEDNEFDEEIVYFMKKESSDNLYEFLEEFLDPYVHHFDVQKASQFSPKTTNSEVWVSGKVLKADFLSDEFDFYEYISTAMPSLSSV